MNLDALREALKWFDPLSDIDVTVAAAARAVLDSEEAWWCETHDAGLRQTDSFPPATCWVFDLSDSDCSMVRARLLAEEKTPRFDPMSDPAYDPDHVTPGGSP